MTPATLSASPVEAPIPSPLPRRDDDLFYEVIIGCEIHAELLTPTKAFCACENRHGGEPNTRVCPVCLGLPGAMPVPSRSFVELGATAGLALGCALATVTKFDRKHYFYPDLPKGYQITQYDAPLCREGHLDLETDGETRRIRIERIHLEEDAGKSLVGPSGDRLVDFNRCGVPLVEIVTRPDLSSPGEAALFMREVRDALRAAGVTDGNLEEGSLRCDANVNLRIAAGGAEFRTPISEIKNLNSFRAVDDACSYEVRRQLAEFRESPRAYAPGYKRTMGWDASKGETYPMRENNSYVDYRFVTEPDIPPFRLGSSLVERARERVGELPAARRERWHRDWGLAAGDAATLAADKALADWFDRAARSARDPLLVARWTVGEVRAALNARGLPPGAVGELSLSPEGLASLVNALASGTITGPQAKETFALALETGALPGEIIREKGFGRVDDGDFIKALVDGVFESNPEALATHRSGKKNLAPWLTGQAVKASKGRADPKAVAALIEKKLAEL